MDALRYTIVETQWGFFGLAGTEKGIFRNCLPTKNIAKTKENLLVGINHADYDKNAFPHVKKAIKCYFEGYVVDFTDIEIMTDGLSDFAARVLIACKEIKYGQKISYCQLAKLAGFPTAPRAVGNVLGANPLPLIVPCHRIIRANGALGGFMRGAKGGEIMKKKLQKMEKNASLSCNWMSNRIFFALLGTFFQFFLTNSLVFFL